MDYCTISLLLVIGRKKAMTLTGFGAAICYGLLFFCLGKYVSIIIAIVAKEKFYMCNTLRGITMIRCVGDI